MLRSVHQIRRWKPSRTCHPQGTVGNSESSWVYWILLEVLEKLCNHCNTLDSVVKVGPQVCMDWRVSEELCIVKETLVTYPVMITPNFDKPFSVAVDASNVFKITEKLFGDWEGTLCPHPRSAAIFGLCSCLRPKCHCVYWTPSIEIFGKSRNKESATNQLEFVLTAVQLNIRHIKGVENVIADCLSRAWLYVRFM